MSRHGAASQTRWIAERHVSMNYEKQQEKILESAIRSEDREKAIQILLDLATFSARKKKFSKAEAYRDRLYDIDPLALSTIVRANEIIEEEKIAGINQTHRGQFAGLYNILTTEQGNATYDSLENLAFTQGQYICRQGEVSGGLFFVNTGKLRVECLQEDQNVFIRFLLPGATFGFDTFFPGSVYTTSVVAVSHVNLHKLDMDAFSRLKEEYPGLESKLKRYCTEFVTLGDYLHQNDIEHRGQARRPIFGKASIHLFADSGTGLGKPLGIELNDISPNGTSFLIRMKGKRKMDMILGQKIMIAYRSEAVSPPLEIQQQGTIVGINADVLDDCLFHIKFDRELDSSHFETILAVFS